MRDELFGLANVQRLFDDAFRSELLFFGAVQTENHFGVADGQSAIAHEGLNFRREVQQPQRVGNQGAALADFGRHFLLLELLLLILMLIFSVWFLGVGMILVGFALTRCYALAAHGALRRRRAFEPARVREVAPVMRWAAWVLAGGGLLLALAGFLTPWLGFLYV